MSLQNRSFFLLDASDTDGPLWLRCRKLTVMEAFELEELTRRVRAAYTPARPTEDDDSDEAEEMDAEERKEKTLAVMGGADRYAIHLVRGYAETEAAPKGASGWTDCRLVVDEPDSGAVVEGAEQVWIESLPPSIRQEIMVRGLAEFSEAGKKVARFRSANAAAAALAAAGDGDAGPPAPAAPLV
jgi:hypothetical protein